MSFSEQSPEWLAVVEWAEDQLEKHMGYLKSERTNFDKTQTYRGRISELEELLDLPKTLTEARP